MKVLIPCPALLHVSVYLLHAFETVLGDVPNLQDLPSCRSWATCAI